MSPENPQGPWGRDQRPPEIEELLEKLQEQFQKIFGLAKGPSSWMLVVLVIVIWFFAGWYKISPEEEGVIQRLGAWNRTVASGLHWRPLFIEKVTKVPVQRIQVQEFGLRTLKPGVRTQYAPEREYEAEKLMLTGDLNCVLVPWTVRYRIGDPYKYLFRVRAPEETLRDLAEATMRTVVGDHSLDEVLMKRTEIADMAEAELQKAMDAAESGLYIESIELERTNVPKTVEPSFNEVNEAEQEKERLIYEANTAYNNVIPEARGKAEKLIQEAEGYAIDRVKRAQGDVTLFLALYEEYVKARDITRQRLYLEAIQELLPRLGNKYIIDADQKGFLPLLKLGEKGE